MKLELKSIQDKGVIGKERIVMKSLSKLDVGQFAVLQTGYDGEVNTLTHDCYWFPDKTIEEGDWIVLYTKSGKQKENVQKSGVTAHFFYWGKDSSKWKTKSWAPVVLQVDSWDFLSP
jgi:hypothetical protein